MNSYITQIKMSLLLTTRNRAAFIFGYGMPVAFFFLFGSMGGASAANSIVGMVLTIGVLGSGFFGAAMIAVINREQNILRRFKVAPISPGPILMAGMVASMVMYMPVALLLLTLANRVYHVPFPTQWPSLFLFMACGAAAFCALGNMIAAVVNSMQEAQVVINLFYLPMLMLSGATIPITSLPNWVQILSQFMPSAYFITGVQSILRGRETFVDNLSSAGALGLTAAIGTLLAWKLFRWEKNEKMKASAKGWLAAALGPFIVLGVYQGYAKTNIERAKVLQRDQARSRIWLIHDARIFIGDGSIIERGSVLVKNGKIERIFSGDAPEAKSLDAEAIEAAGKTLLPGFIDTHVHLGSPGIYTRDSFKDTDAAIDRELAAYLYSGVTAVRSLGDNMQDMLKHRTNIASGSKLGAELFTVGPMFTAADGHGTEYIKYVPEPYRQTAMEQSVRLPQSAEEARKQVAELKTQGVDGIKAILEGGAGELRVNRLDSRLVLAIGEAARAARLPLAVHTGAVKDAEDAIAAGATTIEHGSMSEVIPDTVFLHMKAAGVAYDPTLAVVEALDAFVHNRTSPLDRPLVRQVTPVAQLEEAKRAFASPEIGQMRKGYSMYAFTYEKAKQNLQAAYRAGVTLAPGTDAGNPMMVHGPGLHRELQLWVEAGVPPIVALQAATINAARVLRVDNRMGAVKPGLEANLLLVDGNPMEDIAATERISSVLFKGEWLNRGKLFDQK
jgi:imidazolonepropionase-like amidohydrolase/ABC-type polysaccharide/polyol phosphate export permease